MVHWFIVNRLIKKFLVLYIFGSLLYNSDEVINMATDKPRYTVSVDSEMFQEIENFRFENRYQTLSEATVELIRRGLESIKREKQQSQELGSSAKNH